ncbi:tRNA(Ile)-lysidine synthase [Siccirubricoccus deserti]|uniref:tRNA(Ile)-lysidine synthase n=1 Tax=Siccirubricoccus deserti TaxID=2013562 RepID=A0A9X0QWD0_9PROT|nr:tRNA lysidine(34) synthetase TilS [Siccirubricoccus deserti]MBC4015181.1 tRNA lysidine(34) synthetase TilS [Siccirubricoccus deserti]GGC38328.1 tRNA(Ile)-lysidine synthase [Siccirubricoccus deserti]
MIAEPVSAAEFAALMAPLGPFGRQPRIAAGVSGGPHSLALALLADGWARARGGSLLALVVDHGLRPESAAEAAGVIAQLAGRGIAARLLWLGLPPGAGVQARARAARHGALRDACREAGVPWLLLGHHRADQAETLLFRALRGSGPAGLAGMAPALATAEALVLRPLLGIPPARLEAVVRAAGLTPVRDPSNADPRFARPRLRQVLGDPGGTGPAVAALAEAAAAFATRRRRLESAVADRLAAAAVLRPEGHAELDLRALGRDRVALAALATLLSCIGGRGFPPPAAAVAGLLRQGHGTLAGAWLQAAPAGGTARLLREPAAVGPPVPARRNAVWDGRFRLTGPGDAECSLGALGVAAAARLRHAAPGLPAVVLATLPAIRRHGTLVAVPALFYPDAEGSARFAIVLAPAAAGRELRAFELNHSLSPPASLSG